MWFFLKSLFCWHDYKFHRNIYGDEILYCNGRSEYKCIKCGTLKIKHDLYVKDI